MSVSPMQLLQVVPGETKVFDVTVTNPDDGTAVSVAAAEAWVTVKTSRLDAQAAAVIALHHAAGDVNDDAITAANNVLTITLTPELTTRLKPASWYLVDVVVRTVTRTLYPVVAALQTSGSVTTPPP